MKKTIIILLLSILYLSCIWAEEAIDIDEKETQEQVETKEFYLYDAMNYVGKPVDLSSIGLSRIMLIYEAYLTKKDANDQYGKVLDMDKIADHVNVALYSGQKMINTDIEHWYGDRNIDSDELASRFETLFNAFRDKIDGVRIGNYGVAPSALCVTRFYNNGKDSEEVMLEKWKNNNKKRWDVAKTVDYLSPSVYIAEPNIESWLKDLEYTANEIRKFDPTKKLIVYIWPNYYDKPGSPYFKKFVDVKIWEQMLEGVYKHCDGAVIWNSTVDDTGKKLNWDDKEVKAFVDVTKKFVAKQKIRAEKLTSAAVEPLPAAARTKNFGIYSSLKYAGTPDLTEFGVKPVRVAYEAGLSNGQRDENNILMLDSAKIVQLAKHTLKHEAGMPVVVHTSTWLNDRGKNKEGMLERFQTAERIFKRYNNSNKLSFFNVGPTSLSVMREPGKDMARNIETWYRYSVVPTKGIGQYADIILPTVMIPNDDVQTWQSDFRIMMEEARKQAKGKPVYAYLQTQYFNKEAQPIKADTWFKMLETVYALCDGVIIASNSQSPTQGMKWNDKFDFWKATEAFMKEYKIVAID